MSVAFKITRYFGLRISEGEYNEISFREAFIRGIKGIRNAVLLKYCMYSVILSPLNYRIIRPILWRWMGCDIGKDVFIGYDVWMDFTNSHLIKIGDGVHITNKCILLCHQRDLTNYFIDDEVKKLPYKKKKIEIGDNVVIGMGTIIMPGVSIGKGSIIGAGSVVTKNIPEWVVATGSPAKIIREIKRRDNDI
jgi:acetyltransferase-like isoleucine patch superfamily enzyme